MIELPENPTTGYVWSLDVKEGKGVVHVSDSRYAAASESGIGGGGVRKFILKIQSAGNATVDMKLRRQWEPESAAIEGFKAFIKAG